MGTALGFEVSQVKALQKNEGDEQDQNKVVAEGMEYLMGRLNRCFQSVAAQQKQRITFNMIHSFNHKSSTPKRN